MEFLHHFSKLCLEAAPWLLFGYLFAGIIKYVLPATWLSRQLGGRGPWTTIKAALVGAPLPLCSCGVIPAALGLRRAGASKNATTAFLVATPETGVDSIAISFALLGPFMAIIRPIAAIFSAISAGLLVGLGSAPPETPVASVTPQPTAHSRPANRLKAILRFSLFVLLRDTYRWLLLGLFFAALILTYLPPDFLTTWGSGPTAMVIMALIGVPMYVCATASTPIAVGFLFAGVSPGAVLVFLLAGPATNFATLAIVRNELGYRSLAAYLAGVIGTAFIFGLLTNWLVGQGMVVVDPSPVGHQHPMGQATAIAAAIILGLAMVNVIAQQLLHPRRNHHHASPAASVPAGS